MSKRLRKSWTARLVAVTVSLALTLASVVGAGIHARGHHHHAGADEHTATAPGNSPQTAHVAMHSGSHRSVAAIDAADGPGLVHEHSGCMDFVCHGGLAVIPAASPWVVAPWRQTAVFPWGTQVLASVSPARLDRPPKSSLVSA